MGITPIDIVVYIAFILGFIFVLFFLISVFSEGWKRSFLYALKALGAWIYVAFLFIIIGLVIGFVRGCILH